MTPPPPPSLRSVGDPSSAAQVWSQLFGGQLSSAVERLWEQVAGEGQLARTAAYGRAVPGSTDRPSAAAFSV